MAIKKKAAVANKPKPAKRPNLTAAARARLAEKARKQWSDPDSKLRARNSDALTKLRKRPPRNAATLIREGISEFGACVTALCELLGCSRSLFFDWIKRHDDIRKAYEEGRAIMEERLVSKLYSQALAGYSPAAMFLLKTKMHYRDNGPIPGQQEDSPAERAAKIRTALKAMNDMDGCSDGNGDA